MTIYLWLRLGAVAVFVVSLLGCAATSISPPESRRTDNRTLPPADAVLSISGLGPCTDSADRSLHLNKHEPMIVLVHGCSASAGRFRTLAQVFAFHGQQSICFSYNDRDSLTGTATRLVAALETLAEHMQNRQMTLIGHSQGGLIARNALSVERVRPLVADVDLRLVTISSPFAGIAAADHCGSTTARVLSLGLVVPICMLISGDKWYEITAASPFIRKPGELAVQVSDYVKIVTDERDSCRRYDGGGQCIEDDYVFSIEEQYFGAVDRSPNIIPVEVKAGHAEIVGNAGAVPDKLIGILRHQRILRATAINKITGLDARLRELYQREPLCPLPQE